MQKELFMKAILLVLKKKLSEIRIERIKRYLPLPKAYNKHNSSRKNC